MIRAIMDFLFVAMLVLTLYIFLGLLIAWPVGVLAHLIWSLLYSGWKAEARLICSTF